MYQYQVYDTYHHRVHWQCLWPRFLSDLSVYLRIPETLVKAHWSSERRHMTRLIRSHFRTVCECFWEAGVVNSESPEWVGPVHTIHTYIWPNLSHLKQVCTSISNVLVRCTKWRKILQANGIASYVTIYMYSYKQHPRIIHIFVSVRSNHKQFVQKALSNHVPSPLFALPHLPPLMLPSPVLSLPSGATRPFESRSRCLSGRLLS